MEQLLSGNLAMAHGIQVEAIFKDESTEKSEGQTKEMNEDLKVISDTFQWREDLIRTVRELSRVAGKIHTEEKVWASFQYAGSVIGIACFSIPIEQKAQFHERLVEGFLAIMPSTLRTMRRHSSALTNGAKGRHFRKQ